MNTKTRKSILVSLRAMVAASLLGLSCGVHALCLNPDGSLDDASMSAESIDLGSLPACEVPTKTLKAIPNEDKPQAKIEQVKPELAKPQKKAKRNVPSAGLGGDCRTAGGESRVGSLGVVDMLPACGT